MNDEREAPKLLSNFQEVPSYQFLCSSAALFCWGCLQTSTVVPRQETVDDNSMQSRDLSALTQLTHHPSAWQASFPGEVWTLLHTHATTAGPSSVTYDSLDVFGHIKGSTTHIHFLSSLMDTATQTQGPALVGSPKNQTQPCTHISHICTENCTDRH